MIAAEHGTGPTPGTENWHGQVEVMGMTGVASGHYIYPNRAGGSLRLVLAADANTLTEYGFPNSDADRPFVRIWRKL